MNIKRIIENQRVLVAYNKTLDNPTIAQDHVELILRALEEQQEIIDRTCLWEANGDFYEPVCRPEDPIYDHVSVDGYTHCMYCGGRIVKDDIDE